MVGILYTVSSTLKMRDQSGSADSSRRYSEEEETRDMGPAKEDADRPTS